MPQLPSTIVDAFRKLTLVLAVIGNCASATLAQDNEDTGPLYMQPPFDRVVLKTGESVDVQKLRLPGGGRKVPAVLPTAGELKVRPLEAKNAAAEYAVPWSGIARIDLFEDMIMQEALKLSADEKFDEAFPYFSHLLRRAPDTRGLDDAINRYLQANALTAYKMGEFDRALAILGSLYERSPKANGLAGAVDTVAGKIIDKYLIDSNYKSARSTLNVVSSGFRGLPLTVVDKWRTKFQGMAASQLAEANRLVDERKYLAARAAIAQAVGVWPELNGVKQLQARLQREHPVVTLGVLERSPKNPDYRLDNRAATRAASLIEPTLVQLRGYTAEGGAYRSSVGELELDPSGLEINIRLADSSSGDPLDSSLAASALARQLVYATRPGSAIYNEVLAQVLDDVTVEYPQTVRIKLSSPHVRPEALLKLPIIGPLAALSSRGVFEIAEYNDNLIRFAADREQSGAIAEVHELQFEDDEALVTALSQGIVDVIDRVPPWQLARLRADDKVVVGEYLLPTTHVLVPTGRSPLTEQREFRRALCYGIDRQRFVKEVLLAGSEQPGFQEVSGPFPAGVTLSDPIRYGYNSQVKPRPYDPYMAIVLSAAAWSNVQKSQGVKEPGEEPLPTLKIGHTSDAVARTACIEIAKNLNAIGITVETMELSVEHMLQAEQFVDLKYVELNAWEPVSDARSLLGAQGDLGGASDFMMFALDRLDAARNWNDVRSRLYEIHEVASTDLPAVPLWQTVNHFAYRRQLTGVSQKLVTLFQDIGNWQLEFQAERL